MKRDSFKLLKVASSVSLVLTLAACGGGSSETPPPDPDPTPTPSYFNVTVIDGYIRGAIAYIDLNDNKTRDANEPFTETVEGGAGAIETTGLGLIPENVSVIVDIPAGAVDESTISDENPNGVPVTDDEAFQLVSLPGESVATPLTTLVSLVAGSTENIEEAKAQVAQSLGITEEQVSSDYIADTDEALTVLTEVMVENELIPKNVTTNVTSADVVVAKSVTSTIATVIKQAQEAGTLSTQTAVINGAGKSLSDAMQQVSASQSEALDTTSDENLEQIVNQVGSVVAAVYDSAVMSSTALNEEELANIALQSNVVSNATSSNIVAQALSDEGLSEEAIAQITVSTNVLSNVVAGLISEQNNTDAGLDETAVTQINNVSQIIANVVNNLADGQSGDSGEISEDSISNIQSVASIVANTVGNLLTNNASTNVSIDDIAGIAELVANDAVEQAQELAESGLSQEEIDAQLAQSVNESASNLEEAVENNVDIDDLDGDGIANNIDPDIDNDGVPNEADAFQLDSTESLDTDGDGIGNNADNDDDNDGALDVNDAFPLNNAETLDTDGDGVGNNADSDDDNDTVLDSNDAFPLDNTESIDTDLDGIGNNADNDDDNDGALDINDAFPLNNAETLDTDGDGVGNNADTDDDNDGVPDTDDTDSIDPNTRYGGLADSMFNGDVYALSSYERSDMGYDQISVNTASLNIDINSFEFSYSSSLASFKAFQDSDDDTDLYLSNGMWTEESNDYVVTSFNSDGSISVTDALDMDITIIGTSLNVQSGTMRQALAGANQLEWANNVAADAMFTGNAKVYNTSMRYDVDQYVVDYNPSCFGCDGVYVRSLNRTAIVLDEIFVDEADSGLYHQQLPVEFSIHEDNGYGYLNLELISSESNSGQINFYLNEENQDRRVLSATGQWEKVTIDGTELVTMTLPNNLEALAGLDIDYDELASTFIASVRGEVLTGTLYKQNVVEEDGVWLNGAAHQQLLASFSYIDTDGDGSFDAYDNDDDNDGVDDAEDAFPRNVGFSSDIDNDGIADEVDTDIDGDGVENNLDIAPADATINVAVTMTSSDIASEYLNTEPTFDRVGSSIDEYFTFNTDGSGESSSQIMANTDFTWAIVDGSIEVTFDQNVGGNTVLVSAESLFDSGLINEAAKNRLLADCGGCQYEKTIKNISTTLHLITSDSQAPEFYKIERMNESIDAVYFSIPEITDTTITTENAYVTTYSNLDNISATGFVQQDLVGTWAVPTSLENENFFGIDALTLNQDGSVSSAINTSALTWSVNANGELVITGSVNGKQSDIVIKQLAQNTDGSATFVDMTYDGETQRGYHYLVQEQNIDLSLNTFDSLLMSSFVLETESYRDENDNINISDFFGFYFQTDGFVARVFGNVIVSGDEQELRRWTQGADNRITMTAYRDNSNGIDRNECARTLDNACVAWRERFWQPLNQVGDRLYVIEWERYYTNWNDQVPDWQLLIPPRVNYYEVYDFDLDFIDERYTDGDPDNDGISGSADAFPFDNTEWLDTDNDGLGNNADDDDDNDGVNDWLDDLPLDATETVDTDGDGIGNNSDNDDDNDGVDDANDILPLDASYASALSLSRDNLSSNYVRYYAGKLNDPSVATMFISRGEWTFSDDQGVFTSHRTPEPYNYTISNNTLTLTYTDAFANIESVNLEYLQELGMFSATDLQTYIDNGGELYVDAVVSNVSADLYLAEDTQAIDTFIVSDTTEYTLVDDTVSIALLGAANLAVELTLTPRVITLLDVTTVTGLNYTEAEMLGKWGIPTTVEVIDNTASITSDYATFNADNTGSTEISGASFTWAIEDGDLVMTFADSTEMHLKRLQSEPYTDLVLATATINNKRYNRIAVAGKDSGTATIQSFTDQFLMNSFTLTNPDAYDNNDDVLLDEYFGYILNSNGSGANIFDAPFNIEDRVNATYRTWNTVTGSDGSTEIVISASVSRDDFGNVTEQYSECQLNGTTCLPFRERHWKLLGETADRIYVLEWALWNDNAYDSGTTDTDFRLFIPPRVQFYSKFVLDSDYDGVKDDVDLDDDNDNVPDTADAFPLDPSESLDTDLDGIGNNADSDDDNDGVIDYEDAFPLDASESEDFDLDGIGNNTDTDDDNDGVADVNDASPLDDSIGARLTISQDTVPSAYVLMFEGLLDDPSISFRTIGGNQYTFNDDLTGGLITRSSNTDYTWSVNNDILSITYDNASISLSYSNVADLISLGLATEYEVQLIENAGIFQVGINRGVVGEDWSIVATDNESHSIIKATLSSLQINDAPVSQILYGQDTAPVITTSILSDVVEYDVKDDIATIAYTPDNVVGTWSMPAGFNENSDGSIAGLQSDLVTLNTDFTGTSKLMGLNFTWTVNNEGALLIDYPNINESIKISQLEVFSNSSSVLAEITASNDTTFRSYSTGAVKTDQSVDWLSLQDTFLMSAFTLTDPYARDEDGSIISNQYFGFRLEENGKSTRVINRELDISTPDNYNGWNQYYWQQDDSGKLVIDTRRIDGIPSDCYQEQNPSCITYRQRQWIPLKQVGNRVWVLEWLEINNANETDPSLYTILSVPRINFYEAFDIDSDADGLLDKDDSDIDNDSVVNENDAFPFDSGETLDSDGDLFSDNIDAFPFDATEWFDTDSDGTGNNADADDDNDGIADDIDARPFIYDGPN
ncbi:MAG: thrombospondin type 3 repeat-containing protein [Glaciecola sp.]